VKCAVLAMPGVEEAKGAARYLDREDVGLASAGAGQEQAATERPFGLSAQPACLRQGPAGVSPVASGAAFVLARCSRSNDMPDLNIDVWYGRRQRFGYNGLP
jgi:hypothetical protein